MFKQTYMFSVPKPPAQNQLDNKNRKISPPGAYEFPEQSTSIFGKVSISWRHHILLESDPSVEMKPTLPIEHHECLVLW